MATVDPQTALSTEGLDASEVRQRTQAGHVNTLPEGPSRTTADILRANLVTRFNILLSVLLIIVLVVVHEPRDALFGIVLVTNAAIGIVQELRAKRTLDRLELITAPQANVVRSGRTEQIPVQQIVLDDVIELRSGDQLAVDGEVLESSGLEIDESLLTGEADTVHKAPGDACLSGSFVAAGSGRYRATRVGKDAYAVKLAQEARKFTLVRSELRDGIDWIIAGVSWAVGPVIALLIWSQMRADEGFTEALRGAIAGAVGMIPQGLVLLTSIAFAVGVVRLGRRQVLVKELPAIEGLARVDTVCFDKTGTLTEGRLAVQDVQATSDIDPGPYLATLARSDPHPNATLAAISRAYPEAPPWKITAVVPFSSARKWSAAAYAGEGSWVLGAPDVVAPDDDGILEKAQRQAEGGRRVLVLAGTDEALNGETLPGGLQVKAVIGLGDRIRGDAATTLQYFAEQGVAAKVISGDHPETVAAIAREVGVVGSQHVVDARNLPDDPEELAEVMDHGTVFGRVSPHQKRAMVSALQSRGHVVAMTGDGVNDVLALKDADIGIAIGSGAPASRAVAQLVLIDGRFDTLPGVVGEGRRVISNIERVANLFVTKTVYAIGIAIAIGLVALPFPFLPRHLTLVGAVTIGIPAFFLALAPSSRRARPGFVGRVLRFAVPTGLAAAFATFSAYQLAIAEGVDLTEARTTATLVLTAIGLFALGMVSRPLLPWKKWLIGAMAGLLVISMVSPVSHDFFELNLPRAVVLLASLGIVAITGAAMVGSLQTLGWAKQVPDLLREHPPQETRAWRTAVYKFRELIGDRDVTPPPPEPEPAEPEPPQQGPRALGEIEWFDPDEDFLRPTDRN
jgi:cation-transporting ATPase E